MTPPRPPRSRPATLAKRQEIISAAARTFGTKGYKNGPLTDVADQVDMTHAGVLHHFGSKDQLLLEVLTFRDRADVAALEGQRLPSGEAMFRHLVRTAFLNAERAEIVQAYAVLSAESVTEDHPARDHFEERYRNLRSVLAQAFADMCAERGIHAPVEVEKGAASILAVMDGLQMQWLLDADAVELGEATLFAIEAIVAAVVGQQIPLREDPA